MENCYERVVPYWQDVVAPQILGGKNVLMLTTMNTYRAFLKHLSGFSGNQVL